MSETAQHNRSLLCLMRGSNDMSYSMLMSVEAILLDILVYHLQWLIDTLLM
jgi:hypothetical protein